MGRSPTDRRDGATRTRHRPSTPGQPFQPTLEKGEAGGYASLREADGLVPPSQLGTGTPTSATALFGDSTWVAAATAAALAAEAATRAAADTAEATARAAADTTLQTNITSEASTRAAADTTLQSNITSEAATRASADTTLQTNITAEASARAAADALLQPLSGKNAASGYAGLDGSSKLTGSQQVYGTAANTACQGNDSRLSDSRAPNGAAGGDLTGTFPNPTVLARAITYAKMQAVSATERLLGRKTAGSGDVEEIAMDSSSGTNTASAVPRRDVEGAVWGAAFRTITPSGVNLVSGVATTVYTFATTAKIQVFFVTIEVGSQTDAGWTACAIVITDNGNARIAWQSDGSHLALTMSGMALRGTGATTANCHTHLVCLALD